MGVYVFLIGNPQPKIAWGVLTQMGIELDKEEDKESTCRVYPLNSKHEIPETKVQCDSTCIST